jgi:hypothetical protein
MPFVDSPVRPLFTFSSLVLIEVEIDDHGFLAEPACTATLVPIYLPSVLHAAGISSGAVVVVIVCGGNTFDLDALEQWEGKFGRKEGGDIVLFSGARGELVVE